MSENLIEQKRNDDAKEELLDLNLSFEVEHSDIFFDHKSKNQGLNRTKTSNLTPLNETLGSKYLNTSYGDHSI
jgi:hypothetical protein